MEQFNMEQPSNLLELKIDQQAYGFLYETSRWGKFLSIIGFVMCAIITVVALFAGSLIGTMVGTSVLSAGADDSLGLGMAGRGMLASMGGVFFTILYLLIAILYFLPCLYIYNFSSKMKKALVSQDQFLLNASFKNLKACFRFLGILTLVFLGFYVVMFLIGMMAVMSH